MMVNIDNNQNFKTLLIMKKITICTAAIGKAEAQTIER